MSIKERVILPVNNRTEKVTESKPWSGLEDRNKWARKSESEWQKESEPYFRVLDNLGIKEILDKVNEKYAEGKGTIEISPNGPHQALGGIGRDDKNPANDYKAAYLWSINYLGYQEPREDEVGKVVCKKAELLIGINRTGSLIIDGREAFAENCLTNGDHLSLKSSKNITGIDPRFDISKLEERFENDQEYKKQVIEKIYAILAIDEKNRKELPYNKASSKTWKCIFNSGIEISKLDSYRGMAANLDDVKITVGLNSLY